MFGSLLSSLMSDIPTFNTNGKLSKVVLSNRRRVIGKDDQNPLMTKATTTTTTEQTKANKKRVSFETEPLVCYYNDDGYGEKSCGRIMKNGENNYNIHDHDHERFKVKILMTKEEAARLLAKCKDGGRLEFRDVARELMQIPVNRVNFVRRQGIIDHKEL